MFGSPAVGLLQGFAWLSLGALLPGPGALWTHLVFGNHFQAHIASWRMKLG